jgi:hypothetical protein
MIVNNTDKDIAYINKSQVDNSTVVSFSKKERRGYVSLCTPRNEASSENPYHLTNP